MFSRPKETASHGSNRNVQRGRGFGVTEARPVTQRNDLSFLCFQMTEHDQNPSHPTFIVHPIADALFHHR